MEYWFVITQGIVYSILFFFVSRSISNYWISVFIVTIGSIILAISTLMAFNIFDSNAFIGITISCVLGLIYQWLANKDIEGVEE